MVDEQRKVNSAVKKPAKGGKRLAKNPEDLCRRTPAAGERTTNARIRIPHRDMPDEERGSSGGADTASPRAARQRTERPVREPAKPMISAWAEEVPSPQDNCP